MRLATALFCWLISWRVASVSFVSSHDVNQCFFFFAAQVSFLDSYDTLSTTHDITYNMAGSSAQKKRHSSLYSLKPLSLSDRSYVQLLQQFSVSRNVLDDPSLLGTHTRLVLGDHYHAVAHTCQELLPLVLDNGDTFEWLVQRPAKLFQFLFSKCLAFQKLVRLSRPQKNKWDIVFLWRWDYTREPTKAIQPSKASLFLHILQTVWKLYLQRACVASNSMSSSLSA